MVPLPTRFSSSKGEDRLRFHFLPWQLDKSGPEGDHTPLDWQNQVALLPALEHVFTDTEPAGVEGQEMPRSSTLSQARIVLLVVVSDGMFGGKNV